MKTVEIQYVVSFGNGDAGDWIEEEFELTDEEYEAYENAIEDEDREEELSEIPELQGALERARREFEKVEIQAALFNEDEYVMECQGMVEVSCERLNMLVSSHDSHALSFFGLTDVPEEELAAWDAKKLERRPLVRDFEVGFLPVNPFDEGWNLIVEFVDEF